MHIEQATTEEEIQTIADLAEIIWHQHFTPIIGKEQVKSLPPLQVVV